MSSLRLPVQTCILRQCRHFATTCAQPEGYLEAGRGHILSRFIILRVHCQEVGKAEETFPWEMSVFLVMSVVSLGDLAPRLLLDPADVSTCGMRLVRRGLEGALQDTSGGQSCAGASMTSGRCDICLALHDGIC